MKTIINKKGNKGFIAGPYNFSCGLICSPQRNNMPESIQYVIRPVEIHSCGKKIMRLIGLDDYSKFYPAGTMHQEEYSPNYPIYKGVGYAIIAMRSRFHDDLKASIEATKRNIKMTNENTAFKNKHPEKFKQHIEFYTEFLRRLEAGEISYEFISFDD